MDFLHSHPVFENDLLRQHDINSKTHVIVDREDWLLVKAFLETNPIVLGCIQNNSKIVNIDLAELIRNDLQTYVTEKWKVTTVDNIIKMEKQ